LHPTLVAEILRLFRDPAANPKGAQLICTAHDVSLLGSAHADRPLSREEVWIVEKRRTGESELYPLTDAHPRADESFERGCLRGRYGGVPLLPTNGLAVEVIRATDGTLGESGGGGRAGAAPASDPDAPFLSDLSGLPGFDDRETGEGATA